MTLRLGKSRLTFVLASLAVVGGCSSADSVCASADSTIRLRAIDGQTSAVIGNPIVTATVVGFPSQPVTVTRQPGDSTLTQIVGAPGVYEVTVRKGGYASATQRVTVGTGGACVGPTTVDVTVTLTPVNPQ
jgi:hypothetical protein